MIPAMVAKAAKSGSAGVQKVASVSKAPDPVHLIVGMIGVLLIIAGFKGKSPADVVRDVVGQSKPGTPLSKGNVAAEDGDPVTGFKSGSYSGSEFVPELAPSLALDRLRGTS